MITSWTGLGGSSWVNENNRNILPRSLILNKLRQLAKCPRGNHAVELFATSHPIMNAHKSLHHNNGMRIAPCYINDLAAYLVIGISHPVLFFVGLFFNSIPSVMKLITAPEVV